MPLAAAFALALACLAFKCGHLLLHPQFWAEDAKIFFAGQIHQATPHLLRPYSGYLLALPRTIAWISTRLPVAYAPHGFVYLTTLFSAAVFASLRQLGIGVPFVVLLAAFALTSTDFELYGSVTNIQWLAQFYLVVRFARWLQNRPPEIPFARAVAPATVLFATLTGPMFVPLAPALLLAWTWLCVQRRRLFKPNVDIGVFLAASIFHACVMLANVPPRQGPSSLFGFFLSFQAHALGHVLFAQPLFFSLAAVAAIGAIALASLAARPVVILLVGAAIFHLMLASIRYDVGPDGPQYADRYYFFSKITLWWCLSVCAFSLARWPRLKPLAWALALGPLAVNAASIASLLRRPPLIDLNWPQYAKQIQAKRPVVVPINPVPWVLEYRPHGRHPPAK